MLLLHEQGHEFSIQHRIPKIRIGTKHYKLNPKGVNAIAEAFLKWEGSPPADRNLLIRILWIRESGFTQDLIEVFPLALTLCKDWPISRFAKLFKAAWALPPITQMTAEQITRFIQEPVPLKNKPKISRQARSSRSPFSYRYRHQW